MLNYFYKTWSGDVLVESNKKFRDYLIDYQYNVFNDQVKQYSENLGIDEIKLRKIMELNVTENNINDYGRYDELISTLDIHKAKLYYDKKLSKDLSLRETKILVDQELRKFILDGRIFKGTVGESNN